MEKTHILLYSKTISTISSCPNQCVESSTLLNVILSIQSNLPAPYKGRPTKQGFKPKPCVSVSQSVSLKAEQTTFILNEWIFVLSLAKCRVHRYQNISESTLGRLQQLSGLGWKQILDSQIFSISNQCSITNIWVKTESVFITLVQPLPWAYECHHVGPSPAGRKGICRSLLDDPTV